MTRLALDRALPAAWIDEVFEQNRKRQYPRELLFSSVVELMTRVTLGLCPSLHAAARKMADRLPVSLTALYAKVKRTEPGLLRALVRGSAQRLMPVMAGLDVEPSLPGWQVRILDGNHLPASEKRLTELRGLRGAALPGHTVVVYDPDRTLVCDIVACEDAYESERIGAAALVDSAQPGQAWIGDRHFCTQALLSGLHARGAGFIVREHTTHPRIEAASAWNAPVAIETGHVREQSIALVVDKEGSTTRVNWRRIDIVLDTPTDAGDTTLALWSNLPEDITAATLARLYRKRWRIEGMFGRLESVLHSEIKTLGHPRAALLGFAVAVLAYNVLALLKAVTEQAHRATHPELDVSTYHLTVEIVSGYESMIMLLPSEYLPSADDDPRRLLERLLQLAGRLSPKQLATSKRGPKKSRAKTGYVDGVVARSHVSTARVIAEAKKRR
jgi:IS4 transposase